MGKRGNGEGSIYKRADGRWVGSLVLDDGKRVSLYGKTRGEIADKLTAALSDRASGLPVVHGSKTAREYFTDWLSSIEPTVKPRTFVGYQLSC